MNRGKAKVIYLILTNFALGLITATDLFLSNEIIEKALPQLAYPFLFTIYVLSGLLYLSVGITDYHVYKYGIEKGILFKCETR